MNEISLTDEELYLLMESILSALQNINRAKSLLPSGIETNEIESYSDKLIKLHTKLCEK